MTKTVLVYGTGISGCGAADALAIASYGFEMRK